jgi:hypothetical protein
MVCVVSIFDAVSDEAIWVQIIHNIVIGYTISCIYPNTINQTDQFNGIWFRAIILKDAPVPMVMN